MNLLLSRRAPRASRLAILLALLLALSVLAACGKKGPVQPRLASLPAAPATLQIDQQGDDFLVSWQIPETNQDGAPAEDLRGFHLYRLIFNAADGCPTCRDPEELVAAIELTRPEPAVHLGKRIYWRDASVAPGTGHAYLVVPVTIGGQEGAGIGGHRAWAMPPPPPPELHGTADAGRVRLNWSPPAALPEGQKLLGYNLYRRPAAGIFPPMPLNAAPLRETQLNDFVAEGGRETVYRITTVVRGDGLVLESAPTAEVTVTPSRGN